MKTDYLADLRFNRLNTTGKVHVIQRTAATVLGSMEQPVNNQPSVVRNTPCMKAEIMNCKLGIILLGICKLTVHSLKSLIWNMSPDGALTQPSMCWSLSEQIVLSGRSSQARLALISAGMRGTCWGPIVCWEWGMGGVPRSVCVALYPRISV